MIKQLANIIDSYNFDFLGKNTEKWIIFSVFLGEKTKIIHKNINFESDKIIKYKL